MRTPSCYKLSLKKTLTPYLQKNMKADDKELEAMGRSFAAAMDAAEHVFDAAGAFRQEERPAKAGQKGAPINMAPWDTVGPCLAIKLEGGTSKRQLVAAGGAIRDGLRALSERDEEWKDISRTNRNSLVRRQEKFMRLLDKVVLGRPLGPRAFARSVLDALWEADPGHRCGLCEQEIMGRHLAEVDHVIPHSQGGPTVPTNAQLVQRTCNRAKGGRVMVGSSGSGDDGAQPKIE